MSNTTAFLAIPNHRSTVRRCKLVWCATEDPQEGITKLGFDDLKIWVYNVCPGEERKVGAQILEQISTELCELENHEREVERRKEGEKELRGVVEVNLMVLNRKVDEVCVGVRALQEESAAKVGKMQKRVEALEQGGHEDWQNVGEDQGPGGSTATG
ncbi:hypothetical protein HKX48_002191 [Thoreauomyces humboldtii]|nr:hypothetical protein HKX48_002191 [Thoreauomyces humboldtii]